MTSRCYIEPYSRKYCFTCPLNDCLGNKSPQCPVRQAKKKHREEATIDEFSTRQLSTRYNVYPNLIVSWVRDDKIPAETVRRLKNKRLLIHSDALPIIEKLVFLYKPNPHLPRGD